MAHGPGVTDLWDESDEIYIGRFDDSKHRLYIAF